MLVDSCTSLRLKGLLELLTEHKELIEYLYEDYKIRGNECESNAIDDFLLTPDNYIEDLEILYEININAYL